MLLKSDVEFAWSHEQRRSFEELKHLCSTPPVLTYFDVNQDAEIHCDASKDGLGAVLIQNGRPVAYTSRSLSDVESRYAQIEKEMLSILHAATKFHRYILGKHTIVYNDHKPLKTIFRKSLLTTTMRLQKMLLRLQWYDLEVRYRKGSEMTVADTLSRAYLQTKSQPESELYDIRMSDIIPVSPDKYMYTEIKNKTQEGRPCLYKVIQDG